MCDGDLSFFKGVIKRLDYGEIKVILAESIVCAESYGFEEVSKRAIECVVEYAINKYKDSYKLYTDGVNHSSIKVEDEIEADKIGRMSDTILAQSLCQSCVMQCNNIKSIKPLVEYVLKHIKSADDLSSTYTEWQKQKANKEITDIIKARLDWLTVMKHINNKDNIKTFCKNITKIDINDSYANGETALMRASKLGLYEVALALISAGAYISVKDKNGKSVLNYAAEGGNTKIMELLLARGAK